MKKENIILVSATLFIFIVFGFVTQVFDNYLGLCLLHHDPGMQSNDTYSYISAASDFFHHFKADPMRPLAYPVLIGLPIIFNAGVNAIYLWAIFVNVVAWVLTVWFVFKTLALFTSKRIAWIVSVGCMLCVGNLEYICYFLTETIYACIITGCIYFSALYVAKQKITYLAWSFVLLSFSILVKPTLWPLYFLVLLILVYIGFRKSKVSPGPTISKYFAILLLAVTSISFQLGMMKKDFGVYTLSFNGKKTLYEFIGSYAASLKNNTSLGKEERTRVEEMNGLIDTRQWQKIDSISDADRNEQLKNNTRNYLKALRIDIECNTFEPGYFAVTNTRNWPFFDFIESACIWLSYWQNVLFTEFCIVSVALIVFFRKKLGNKVVTIALINWVIGVFIILISGISFWQLNRFHVVFTPLVLINFGLLLSAETRKLSRG